MQVASDLISECVSSSSDCEYIYMSLYVIDCKIWWLFPEMCPFQSIAIITIVDFAGMNI